MSNQNTTKNGDVQIILTADGAVLVSCRIDNDLEREIFIQKLQVEKEQNKAHDFSRICMENYNIKDIEQIKDMFYSFADTLHETYSLANNIDLEPRLLEICLWNLCSFLEFRKEAMNLTELPNIFFVSSRLAQNEYAKKENYTFLDQEKKNFEA